MSKLPRLMPAFLDLANAPAPLTTRQRAAFWIVAVVCAASRFPAMSRTLWDWDEALFCLAMRDYDVTLHHPHPPGFPFFIALAKIARLATGDDFRALQSVSLLAACLLMPAVFLFARELRMRFLTALIAAGLCAFFPNVWYFGGTAFSDVPSVVIVLFAVVFLLRGCRDANSYLAGALLLALAAGIRPQNLLVGFVPAVLATWVRGRESMRDVVFAATISVTALVLLFVSAVHATGSWEGYSTAVRAHGLYISEIDSFRSEGRPHLWRLFDRFFFKQYQSPLLNIVTSMFVAIAAVFGFRNRDRSLLLNLLTFGPFAIMAWLMLDRFSINRFAIGYIPMFAVFAAAGIHQVARGRERVEGAIGALLAVSFAVWTFPALTEVRRSPSPVVAAVDSLRAGLNPRAETLYVGFSMVPFIEYFVPSVPFVTLTGERGLTLGSSARRGVFVAEIDATTPHGAVFTRERGRLWNIARRHYFSVAVQPLSRLPRFQSGWYAPERAGRVEWRWMSGRSVTILPPEKGDVVLELGADIPDELLAFRPAVTVRINGRLAGRFVPVSGSIRKDFRATAAPDGEPNTLEIEIERTFNPAREKRGDDARDLGLRVWALGWGPA